MPTLAVVNFNIVCATAGGFVTLFGLVSYLFKEKFYLSEALISSIFGVIFGPHVANLIKPLDYANGNSIDLETITLYFTRLVLGVQLVLAGVQLPSKYLQKEWKSLSILLGPGMCIMWMVTSLLIWALVPNVPFLFAMAVGSCVTPTDPILSNSIVKGKFADKNIPPSLQKIIIAESGANDGLGYPFLFLALYLIKYTGHQGLGSGGGGAGKAMGLWFGETWAYVIILSVVYGAVVGWIAKELLHWAEDRHYVDRESFLVFAITLAVSLYTLSLLSHLLTRTTALHRRYRRHDRLRRRARLLHSRQCLHLGRLVPTRNERRLSAAHNRHAPQRRRLHVVRSRLPMAPVRRKQRDPHLQARPTRHPSPTAPQAANDSRVPERHSPSRRRPPRSVPRVLRSNRRICNLLPIHLQRIPTRDRIRRPSPRRRRPPVRNDGRRCLVPRAMLHRRPWPKHSPGKTRLLSPAHDLHSSLVRPTFIRAEHGTRRRPARRRPEHGHRPRQRLPQT
jgi:hypothetical protein